MNILYQDSEIIVCQKPVGAESEDGKPNAVPTLLREALNLSETTPIFTVHRLDKQVGGVMVYGKTKAAAGNLSAQMQAHQFTKEYRAVIEGTLPEPQGRWEDLLYHDKRKNKVFTVKKERKGVKHAALRYTVLGQGILPSNTSPDGMEPCQTAQQKTNNPNAQKNCSLLKIELETGRTHQIRVQCASRKLPLLGDGRYGSQIKGCDIALFSHKIGFVHPKTGEQLTFTAQPPCAFPWDVFAQALAE